MTDPRVVNLARTLVQYSTKVQPNDFVAIYGQPVAATLIREVYREVLQSGARPYPFVGLEGLDYIFFAEASDDQLKHVSRVYKMVIEEFDALIDIRSLSNTRSLSNIDPARQILRAKAYSDLMKIFMERGASKELRWSITMFPTHAYAQYA